jgi:hypothetical protein
MGGVLPHGALGALKPADAEAVQLHQLTRMVDVQVPLWQWSGPLQLGRSRVAGHQPIALGAGAEAVAAQHPPHPIGRQHDPAPGGPGQLGGDPGRPEPGMSKGEGDHPLLHQGAGGIGHPRHPSFPGPQDLRAVAVQLVLPAVVGGGVDAHGAAGGPHIAEVGGDREDS